MYNTQPTFDFSNGTCATPNSCNGRACYCMWNGFYLVMTRIGVSYKEACSYWKAINSNDDLRDDLTLSTNNPDITG